jgi:hypothetical protein
MMKEQPQGEFISRNGAKKEKAQRVTEHREPFAPSVFAFASLREKYS